MRFVSYEHRKKVAAALRPIYTAPRLEAAESELLALPSRANQAGRGDIDAHGRCGDGLTEGRTGPESKRREHPPPRRAPPRPIRLRVRYGRLIR